jgi:hypothetical protein
MKITALVLLPLILLIGCSSGQNAGENTGSSAAAAGSTPGASGAQAAAQASGSTISSGGCTIDLVKVCQSFFNQPEFVLNGERYDWNRYSRLAHPHEDVTLPPEVVGDDLAASARCHITIQNRTVTSAEMARSGNAEKMVERLKSEGFCSENSPDYDKVMASVMQKNAK